jgi:hypothetical protein
MNGVIKANSSNPFLFCIYSKEKIDIGEKFYSVIEYYNGEKIHKAYKMEYIDYLDEEE